MAAGPPAQDVGEPAAGDQPVGTRRYGRVSEASTVGVPLPVCRLPRLRRASAFHAQLDGEGHLSTR